MASQIPQPSGSRSELSEIMDASSNMSLAGRWYQHRHQLVHCDTANAATTNITQDAHIKAANETTISKNMKQYVIGCLYIHIKVDVCSRCILLMAGQYKMQSDQFIAACNGKNP
jgi:hypothetical protein